MRVTAIVAAGGQGQRLATGRPKQFVEIEGRSLLQRSIETLAASPLVSDIIVALPEAEAVAPPSYLRAAAKPITVVAGGASRQASVANAFARVAEDAAVVVIHDAARPFVTPQLIARTIEMAAARGAAIAALPVRDTVKQATGEPAARRIVRTLPRDTIFLAQTPQAFRRDVLARALAAAGPEPATDEAVLVERAGTEVYLVEGEAQNIKVTTPGDLAEAQRLSQMASTGSHECVQAQPPHATGGAPLGAIRIGTGYDLHRLIGGRPLILGGVRIPFELGLQGHSDADVACHAVTDALLGAAALGDIGRLFPETADEWKDADSLQLLATARARVAAAGFAVVNVDVTIIAERPKLVPHLDAMRTALARALGVSSHAVSIKGKTNEGVGEIGRGEAMACHAVALLIQSSSRQHEEDEGAPYSS